MALEKIVSETTPEGVLILTLNDPATRNALGEPLRPELLSEVDRFEHDPDLKVLVITGTDPAFCSGANVRNFDQRMRERDRLEPSKPSPWEQLDPIYTARETGTAFSGPMLVHKLHNLQKPTFAAVNGQAYGAGCGLALSCDFRIASERAQFNEAFIRNGLAPGDGSAWQLPKIVGMSNALWMLYSGDSVDGTEAFRIGLANKVVPHEKLMESTLEMAAKLVRGPLVAMALVKQLIHQAYQQDFAEHFNVTLRAHELTRVTEDHREAVRAFFEKRPPQFKGR